MLLANTLQNEKPLSPRYYVSAHKASTVSARVGTRHTRQTRTGNTQPDTCVDSEPSLCDKRNIKDYADGIRSVCWVKDYQTIALHSNSSQGMKPNLRRNPKRQALKVLPLSPLSAVFKIRGLDWGRELGREASDRSDHQSRDDGAADICFSWSWMPF